MTDKLDVPESCCPGPDQPVDFPLGLDQKARLFKALGDEVRLKLLHLVRDDEICVCDMVTILGMAQGTLSHHLSVLQQAGLVTARKQGRWNYYQATPLAKNPHRVFGGEVVTADR